MSGIMLSPKVQRMQRSIRINDGQLLGLAEKARYDSRLSGFLYKRCADSNKWLLRWFRLYQVQKTTRALWTRPFRRTRTQTEVRSSDSGSDLRNCDFSTP
jgi:hypothetical protein